jgi:phosphatidylinositol alpha-1,6-mannosyltransferase
VAKDGLGLAHTPHVIHDAVDVKKLTPGCPSLEVLNKYRIPDPTTHTNILTLGRIGKGAEHKGYERLLIAFQDVSIHIPRARLIFAGSGDLFGAYKQQAAALGLGNRVAFTGSISDHDLKDVYRAAHIFSLVSDRGHGRGEGVPVTPIEAAACGIPSIVGDEDGSPEAVQQGITGFAIPSRDTRRHADVLIRMARDATLTRGLGEAARARAVRDFSYEAFVSKHESLLRTEIAYKRAA